MKRRLIALLGISGVGKTRLLTELSQDFSFQHLTASSLIQEGRKVAALENVAHDALMASDIEANQNFLISGFRTIERRIDGLLILDGHSVVDTPSGLTPIDAEVFRELQTESIVFLADTAPSIHKRRIADQSRNRPNRTVDELQVHQNMALINAMNISLKLSLPMIVINPLQKQDLVAFLARFTS